MWATLPILVAIIPFGLIYGTVAREAGLDMLETMALTVVVVAGAAQLVSLQVLSDGAPVAVAILTGAVVNLRMAMYSASLAAHWQEVSMLWRVPAAWFLHDQAFALSMARYDAEPDEPITDKLGFFFGVGIVTVLVWLMASYLGALFGTALPESWGLDFVVPATFLAVVAPMVRGTANVVAALTAATLGVLLHPLPGGLGLILASAAGIGAGMATARRLREREGGA
ncbi:MAG: AzlC family ABC transporter permease [Pseudomonadota bacterium]